MNARERLASWLAVCGAPSGGENLLRIGAELYLIDQHPRELGNGALQGRIHAHNGSGFFDVGGWKINADGTVAICPACLRGHLPGMRRDDRGDTVTTGGDAGNEGDFFDAEHTGL